ncbi:hypothetical protein KY290_027333 [Solanum tuberosum]|uniref:Uncharacterized protein n=1 Tax=Solanum tuberosum TaxID=4113 RepID=A0ABQ7UGI3_SOLTU|nr:hypothetical protein KY290_027333 [Solanum tuberosum]
MDNPDSLVVVNRRVSDVDRTSTNFDLYSNNSIRLVGVNLDGVVDESTDNGVISDVSNLFIDENQLFKIRNTVRNTLVPLGKVYARRQGITDVVAVLIMDKFINPSTLYTPKDITEDMLKVHGVAMTYMQA